MSEGTRVEASGDARLGIGGKLDLAVATSTRSSSEEKKIHGALELSATKSDSGSEKGLAPEGAYAKKTAAESKAIVGDIAAGRDFVLATGGDARLEGTQLKAGRTEDTAARRGGAMKAACASTTSVCATSC